MNTLPNDVTRCHDSGCNQAQSCLRFILRNAGGDRTPHMQSLFPYDIPICDPCPHFITKKEEESNE